MHSFSLIIILDTPSQTLLTLTMKATLVTNYFNQLLEGLLHNVHYVCT